MRKKKLSNLPREGLPIVPEAIGNVRAPAWLPNDVAQRSSAILEEETKRGMQQQLHPPKPQDGDPLLALSPYFGWSGFGVPDGVVALF